MVISVSTAKLACMVIVAILGFILPLGGMLVWWRKKQANLLPFLAGFSMYILGVLICEQILGAVLLKIPSFQDFLEGHIWILALYSGLLGCLFEEGSKYIGLRFFLKNHRTKEVSISFGLGFAALASIFNSGMTMLSSAMTLYGVRDKSMEQAILDLSLTTQDEIESFTDAITYYLDTPTYLFALNGLEAIAFFMIQAFLTVLVFQSIYERKTIYFIIALVIRFVYNGVSCLYAYDVFSNEILLEILLLALGVGTAVIAYRHYLNMMVPEKSFEIIEEKFAYHKDKSGKSLRNIAATTKSGVFASEEEQEAAYQEAMRGIEKDKNEDVD